MRRAVVRWGLLAVLVGGIVFLFVLPGRVWLAQGRASNVAHRQDTALTRENTALAQRLAQLHNPAYLEQLARQEFGLVMPGEQAYALLPRTSPSTTVPSPKGH
jgi:cell division protein FtsB